MDLVTRLLGRRDQTGAKGLAVASAADHEVMSAVQMAVAKGLIRPLFSGEAKAIRAVAAKLDFDISAYCILPASTPEQAARVAVDAVTDGRAEALMKGHISTSVLLKAVLDKTNGIRGPGLLSHLACFVLPALNRPVFLTDAAINIAPDALHKKNIIDNAVTFMKRLGYDNPIVGVLAAIEKINQAMQATLDAEILLNMQDQGKLIGCRLGGPYALDNALFESMARLKGMTDPLAGHADLLLAPTIEAGNVLYKAMSFLAGGESAGVVIGAKVPIVLTSRSDSDDTKLHSIALALVGSQDEGLRA